MRVECSQKSSGKAVGKGEGAVRRDATIAVGGLEWSSMGEGEGGVCGYWKRAAEEGHESTEVLDEHSG